METRTYDPEDDDGIGKLVREALGETHRPFEPGAPKPAEPDDEDDEAGEVDDNPFTAAWPSWEGVGDEEPGDNDE